VPAVYTFGEAVLDTRAGHLAYAGQVLALEPRTFDVLRYLVEHPGRLVPHQELIESVWGQTNVTAHSLTQAVSQLRLALRDDARKPRFIQTVHRRGYQFVAPVIAEKSAETWAITTRWNVPRRVTRLIGRDALVERAAAEMSTSRLVTLAGPGGVGKTQVALEVGRLIADRFTDGVLFIDLTSETDAFGVARALSREMRVDPSEIPVSRITVANALRDRNVLLIFDNCEHLAEPVGQLALTIQSNCPDVHILITSQRHVNTPGQRLVRVPPLDSPSAVSLFVERAQSVNPDFVLHDANARAVEEICHRLDGVPLAIELAAARSNVLTPEQIESKLGSRFELLATPHPEATARHRSLDATIAWSVSLLSESEQHALEQVSVFSGGWSLAAAETVLNRDASAVVDALASLVDKSLVGVDIDRREARYSLLDSIRLYSRGRLLESPDYASIRDRHLLHFRRFSDEVEQHIHAEPRAWQRRVREEHSNLSDALAWALTTPQTAEEGLRLCCNLRWAWRLEGNYVESREWLQQALASAAHAPPSLVGKAWIVLALAHHHRGEFGQARQALEKGLAILPRDDRAERAFGTMLGAYIELLAGSIEASDAIASAVEAEIDALEDDRLAGFALIRRGMAAGLASRTREAVELLERAATRLRHGHDPFLLAFAGVQLSLQRFLADDFAGARVAALESLRDASELDNLRAVAGAFEICGYLALQENDARTSARLLGAAERLREITAAPLLANFSPANARAHSTVSAILGRADAEMEMRAGASMPVREIIASLLGA
jgi:predicted ATPase/DNA-binding winged helix-turn-helix (wHTH) protein